MQLCPGVGCVWVCGLKSRENKTMKPCAHITQSGATHPTHGFNTTFKPTSVSFQSSCFESHIYTVLLFSGCHLYVMQASCFSGSIINHCYMKSRMKN